MTLLYYNQKRDRAPPEMAHSKSRFPQRKVTASVIAGAIVTLAVSVLEKNTSVRLTKEETGALTVITTFAFGYATPPASGEIEDDKEDLT